MTTKLIWQIVLWRVTERKFRHVKPPCDTWQPNQSWGYSTWDTLSETCSRHTTVQNATKLQGNQLSALQILNDMNVFWRRIIKDTRFHEVQQVVNYLLYVWYLRIKKVWTHKGDRALNPSSPWRSHRWIFKLEGGVSSVGLHKCWAKRKSMNEIRACMINDFHTLSCLACTKPLSKHCSSQSYPYLESNNLFPVDLAYRRVSSPAILLYEFVGLEKR